MIQEKPEGGRASSGRGTAPHEKYTKREERESEISEDEYYKLLEPEYLNERVLPKSKTLAEIMKYVPSQARIHKLKMSEDRKEVALTNVVHPVLDYEVYELRDCIVCQQQREAPKKKFAYPDRQVNCKTPQEARTKLNLALKDLYQQVAFVRAFFDRFSHDFLGGIPKEWENSLPHYTNFLKVVYRLSDSLYPLTATMCRVTSTDQMIGWCKNSIIKIKRVDKQGRLVLDVDFDNVEHIRNDEYTDESEDEEPDADPPAPIERDTAHTGEAPALARSSASIAVAASSALSTAAGSVSAVSVGVNEMEEAQKVSNGAEVIKRDSKNTLPKKKLFVGYEFKYRSKQDLC